MSSLYTWPEWPGPVRDFVAASESHEYVTLELPGSGRLVRLSRDQVVKRTPISYVRLVGDEDGDVAAICDFDGCPYNYGPGGVQSFACCGTCCTGRATHFATTNVAGFMEAVAAHAVTHLEPTPGRQADEDLAAELAEDARRDDHLERTAE